MVFCPKNQKQRGNAGVFAIMFIAIVIVVITLLPSTVSPPAQISCMVGIPPSQPETLKLPGIKLDQDYYDDATDQHLYWGYQNSTDIKDYVLIRSKVPTAKESIPVKPKAWTFLGPPPPLHELSHTINMGEQQIKPGYDLYYPVSAGEIDLGMQGDQGSTKSYSPHNEGIILFVKKDPASIKHKDDKTIMEAEIYQDKALFERPGKPYVTEDLFACYGGRVAEEPHMITPNQSNSPNQEQLQLQWVYLTTSNYWAVHCKPAVYLYPPKKTLVNVKVHPAGTLLYTDPFYDSDKGWNVEANPDGRLVNLGSNNFMKNYDYLYFESRVPDAIIKKPTKGWVVKSSQATADSEQENTPSPLAGEGWGEGAVWFNPLEQKFNDILPKLGLNETQTRDFIEYWKKALPYSPYYFIGVINQQNVDEIERLEITPKPDSLNRVRIYFERLDEPKVVESPDLTELDSRLLRLDSLKFRVVEWGGMVKMDPNHPFTCSQ